MAYSQSLSNPSLKTIRAFNCEDFKLTQLFWSLNHKYFAGILPIIDLKFSSRLKTTGGQYFKKPFRLIQVSTRYLEMPNSWEEIKDTLGHEMIHYWLDFLGKPCGHNSEFYQKLNECGFQRYSRLVPLNMKYIYRCPACNTQYYRRKKGLWSCGPCSGDNFNAQYKLILFAENPITK